MITVILVIHLIIAIALVGTILLQRSEGGALGIGGGGGGGGGLMTGRAAGNVLTRTTAILAACFFATSMILAVLADSGERRAFIDDLQQDAPADTAPALPTEPAGPAAPIAE